MKKQRLDQLVYDLGLVPSRERAKTTIMAGLVLVNGQRVDKPGTAVDPMGDIRLKGEALPYVSRGGLKLEKALKVFPVNPTGRCCLDCGASTGGFTDVLLQNGAAKVWAVDVGYGQLHWKLRSDDRVVSLERTNVRYLSHEQIPDTPDLAVMDLAFISLELVFPAVSGLLADGADVICLVKPQFEAGKDKVGKKGVVRDPAVHLEVLERFLEFAPANGLAPQALDFSPIKGPEGNIEYLAWLVKGGTPAALDAEAVVAASHAAWQEKQPPEQQA